VPVGDAPPKSLNPVEVSQRGDHVEARRLHLGSTRLINTVWVGMNCCAVAQKVVDSGFRFIWISISRRDLRAVDRQARHD
jgi:hypothetical protein